MSIDKWSKYEVSPSKINTQNKDKWSQYEIVSPEQEGDDWAPFIGKSALKGAMSIADLPKAVANIGEGAVNLARKYPTSYHMFTGGRDIEPTDYSSYIPDTGDLREIILEKTGIDLEPHPKNEAQRIAGHALEFGAGAGPVGALSKGAKFIDRFNKAKQASLGGAGIGAASGLLQEGGVDPLTADIAAIASPYGLKAAGNTAGALTRKGLGLGKKSLKLDVAQAARDLNIDLPATVLTDNKATSHLDQIVGKTPFFGDKLKDKYVKAEDSLKKSLNEVYDKIGPQETDEISNEIARLYKVSKGSVPKTAKVKPVNTIKALEDIDLDADILSDSAKKVQTIKRDILNAIKPKIVSKKYGNIDIPVQDYSVNRLINNKQQLNSIINWDVDQGVKNQLRNVTRAISDDIAAYGKQNPKWYKTYKDADKLYASVAKRKDLEGLLTDKSTNQATDVFSYNALSKNIHDPAKEMFLKNVSGDQLEQVKKIGTIARAMAVKNSSNMNPSGTAYVTAVLGTIAGLYTDPLMTASTLAKTTGTLAVGTALLTNKKFIDKAIKMVEKPNQINAVSFNKELKKITGYGATALMQNVQE